MANFTNGKPRIATKEDCNAPWAGNKKNFRCGFCGYKFKIGDYWRFQFTNDMSKCPGNPLVCERCDDEPEKVREKWKQKYEEWHTDKWWWFRR